MEEREGHRPKRRKSVGAKRAYNERGHRKNSGTKKQRGRRIKGGEERGGCLDGGANRSENSKKGKNPSKVIGKKEKKSGANRKFEAEKRDTWKGGKHGDERIGTKKRTKEKYDRKTLKERTR